jgi:hypothetical protein
VNPISACSNDALHEGLSGFWATLRGHLLLPERLSGVRPLEEYASGLRPLPLNARLVENCFTNEGAIRGAGLRASALRLEVQERVGRHRRPVVDCSDLKRRNLRGEGLGNAADQWNFSRADPFVGKVHARRLETWGHVPQRAPGRRFLISRRPSPQLQVPLVACHRNQNSMFQGTKRGQSDTETRPISFPTPGEAVGLRSSSSLPILSATLRRSR